MERKRFCAQGCGGTWRRKRVADLVVEVVKPTRHHLRDVVISAREWDVNQNVRVKWTRQGVRDGKGPNCSGGIYSLHGVDSVFKVELVVVSHRSTKVPYSQKMFLVAATKVSGYVAEDLV